MERKKYKRMLTDLSDDMLAVILGKVGEDSHPDFQACTKTCTVFRRVSKFPDVLKILNLRQSFPPPWDRIHENSELLYECAEYGNVHAIFLCGLIDFYYKKYTIAGSKQLMIAAQASHPEAMYLYGMILINEGQMIEGSMFLKKLWKTQGLIAVRRSLVNCKPVILELSVRQYRDYDLLHAHIEVGDDCVVGDYEEVCDSCFISKEIFRFIDYMHFF